MTTIAPKPDLGLAVGKARTQRRTPARQWGQSGLAALVMLLSAVQTAAASTAYVERMHVRAVESFRQGRFPEAYGRFIDLANAGHPASARYALWMCEQGPVLFGKDWGCAPHEIEDWTRLASVAKSRAASPSNQVPLQPLVHRRR